MGNMPAMAITITKAASVTPQETSSSSAGSSLIPTVLKLVSGVQQLNAQQKALTAECVPSAQEITFVDNTMKEWAKRSLCPSQCPKGTVGQQKGACRSRLRSVRP